MRSRSLKGAEDLDPLLKRIGKARCVLLGEASHGTSEYYTWRARISERFIQEKGFSFVAVEGDWPDCYEVNRYVGVIYDPAGERHGNYVPTVLPRRYDAFVYLDETRALRPFEVRPRRDGEPPKTFPSGE